MKKHKTKKWRIVYISEKKYNFYENVDPNKLRPVLIWNDSNYLKGRFISFYCTTKYNLKFSHFHIKILDAKSRKNGKDTWVDLSKIFFVKRKDVDWNRDSGIVKDHIIRNEIVERLSKYFCKNDKTK
ncbi:MAG: hypothetical protein ACRCW6_02010 [Mycoplasmoidaceae bacterium]